MVGLVDFDWQIATSFSTVAVTDSPPIKRERDM